MTTFLESAGYILFALSVFGGGWMLLDWLFPKKYPEPEE